MKKKFIIILIGLSIFSCAKPQPSKGPVASLPGLPDSIIIGKSSEKDLKVELGEPSAIHELPEKNSESIEQLDYQDKGSYRFVNNKLESYFRNPIKEEEKYIQFWRQSWKNKIVREEPVDELVKTHASKILQLINEKDKTTVLFEEESGEVKRIVHYE